MAPHSDNVVLDRLLRHMAWANQQLLQTLAGLPDETLVLAEPGSDWPVGEIAHHLVSAAGFYVYRLSGEKLAEPDVPRTAAAVLELAASCAQADARLRELAAAPEESLIYQRPNGPVARNRSTVVAQAIHHATEHRAQIASSLADHGVKAIDLDALDLWAFGDFEGKGE